MADPSLVDRLVAADAVRFGEFELSHGGTSEYYVDKYRFETEPGCLRALADAFAERLDALAADSAEGAGADEGAAAEPESDDGAADPPILAGVALGAVPLVAATSVAADRPYVIVRKQTKEYGTGNRIEGDLPAGARVIVIEDVATTGQSAVDAAEALREAGATVERVLVVVDREEGASEHLAEHDLQLDALLTASDLLAVAED